MKQTMDQIDWIDIPEHQKELAVRVANILGLLVMEVLQMPHETMIEKLVNKLEG